MPETLTAEQLALKDAVDNFVDGTLRSLEPQLEEARGHSAGCARNPTS